MMVASTFYNNLWVAEVIVPIFYYLFEAEIANAISSFKWRKYEK